MNKESVLIETFKNENTRDNITIMKNAYEFRNQLFKVVLFCFLLTTVVDLNSSKLSFLKMIIIRANLVGAIALIGAGAGEIIVRNQIGYLSLSLENYQEK